MESEPPVVPPGRMLFPIALLGATRVATRIPSAVLPLVVGALFGISADTDVFFLVYAVVATGTSAAASALEMAVVPFCARARSRPQGAERLIGAIGRRVVMWGVAACATLIAGAMLWAVVGRQWLVEPWGRGWEHVAWLSVVPATSSLAAVLSGYLNESQRFNTAAVAAAWRGGTAIVTGYALSASGIVSFSIGIVAGEVAALLWLCAAVGRGSLRWMARRRDTRVAHFGRFFRALLVASMANSSRGLIDRLMAALLGVGSVSLLEYSERAFLIIVSTLGGPFATVALSTWATLYHQGKQLRRTGLSRLRAAVLRAHWILLAVGAVVTVACIVMPLDLLVRRAGMATVEQAGILRRALLFYALGAIPYFLGLGTSQAILTLRDGAFIAKTAVFVAVSNVILDGAGLLLFGLPGIALSSSVLHTLGWALLFMRLRRRWDTQPRSVPV